MNKQIEEKEEIKKIISDICPFYKEYGSCDKCNSELDIDDPPCYWECIAREIVRNHYRKQSEGEWISVEDRLPEREGMYLAHTSHGRTMICFYVDYYCNGKPDWERHDVTHWMPLPKPPKMKGGAV